MAFGSLGFVLIFAHNFAESFVELRSSD